MTLRLVVKDDGSVVLDRAAQATDRLEHETDQAAAAARRLSSAQEGLTGSLRGMMGVIGGLVSAAAIGGLIKKTFDYNQELESTQISIAGLLNAYKDYAGASDSWLAAQAESKELLKQLQVESLKTAATVPQIGENFALTFGAIAAGGIKATNEEILKLTVRLTQAGNAFRVPAEQMRQEINSLLTAQITQDSTIAKRLGLDNATVKELLANGKLIEDLIKRTDAYSKAAEAQSNTLAGKLVNTTEMVVSTLSRIFEGVKGRAVETLDRISAFFTRNGDAIVNFSKRVILAIENIVTSVRNWVVENQALLKEIASVTLIVGAVVGGYTLIAGAIALIASPTTLAIAGIVALAYTWQKVSKFSEIKIGGYSIAQYLRVTFHMVQVAMSGFILAVVQFNKTLWYIVKGIFGSLVDLMLSPFHFVVTSLVALIDRIPESMQEMIPKFDTIKKSAHAVKDALANAFKPMENFGKAKGALSEFMLFGSELSIDFMKKFRADAKNTSPLPTATDIVQGAWDSAAAWLKSKLPNLAVLGEQAMAAITGTMKAGIGGTKLTEAQQKALAEALQQFDNFIGDFRRKTSAIGDPMAELVAKIEVQRADALKKLVDFKEKLSGVLGADVFKAAEVTINQYFNAETFFAIGEKSGKALAKGWAEGLKELDDVVAGIQERIEDARINSIEDAEERERAIRTKEIERWYEGERKKIEAEKKRGVEVVGLEEELLEAKDELLRRGEEQWRRSQREQLVGTREWAAKMAREIGSISDQVTRTIGESKLELTGFFDDVFTSIAEGNLNLADSFDGLIKGISRSWARMLSDMLTKTIVNGESIVTQLKGMWSQLGVAGESGPLDAGLAGAGLGGMVGGVFQTPTNYAGVGGALGGGIGAALGAAIAGYFTGGLGAGAGAQIGAVIGTTLGTAIGSMIQKGKDSITVAIRDGVATVTEKGISAQARLEIETQVQRRFKEEVKGWRQILDLFPQYALDAIERLTGSDYWKARIGAINGGVENADLTDEGALGALSDFLGNDMPKAVFEGYRSALTIALTALGVQTKQLTGLFGYWGTLQGKELQDAVRSYVTTLLGAIEMRDLMAAPFETRLGEARRRAGMTAGDRLGEIDAEIASIVASASKLTDIEDIAAAQQRVNELSRQRYEMEIAYLQRIDSIQRAITDSVAAQREQIQLAGKDDQGKIDYYYRQMLNLRGRLENATDPEEIQRLTQQIQQYVSQAFGLAPDNEENRNKLLDILSDIESISAARLQAARDEVKARDEAQLDILQQMLDQLIGIGDALVTAPGDDKKPDPDRPGNDPPGTGDPKNRTGPGDGSFDDDKWGRPDGGRGRVGGDDESLNEPVFASMEELLDVQVWNTSQIEAALRELTPAAIGGEVAKALQGMSFVAVTSVDAEVDLERLLQMGTAHTVLYLRDNPYATRGLT